MGTTETLRTLLDGRYPETRDRVRAWLSEPGNEPVDDLPMEEHRERVLAWARELSSEGDTAIGYPGRVRRQGLAGPERDRVRDARDGRPLAAGQVRRAVRPLRRRDPAPRHRAPPRALPARRRLARAARLLRDDRDRPRLQRPGARDDRDLRRRARGVRHPHARRRRAQGLHRQRRPRRAHGRRLRPAAHAAARSAACTRCSCRSATRTATPLPGVRIEDCGAKLGLNGVDNGRIWFDHVRVPRENLLDHYAQVAPDGTYFSPIENPTKRFFTMIGTLIQGRISVSGASISGVQGRADDRRPPRAGAPPVRPARAARRRCCWTTARTSGGCCRRWPRPTRCRSPSSGWSTSCTRCSRTRTPTTARGASSRRSPRASRPSPPGTRATRSRAAARRAAARATCARAASPR